MGASARPRLHLRADHDADSSVSEIRRPRIEPAHDLSAGRDDLLITAAGEILSSRGLADDTWNRLAAAYVDAQLEEILLLPGFYRIVAGFVNTIGVAFESGLQSVADFEQAGSQL